VFTWSTLAILAFIVLTLALQDKIEPFFTALRNWLTGTDADAPEVLPVLARKSSR